MKYLIFNRTDGVYAHPEAVSHAEAQRLISELKQRYERQGFYSSASRGRIPISELELEVVRDDDPDDESLRSDLPLFLLLGFIGLFVFGGTVLGILAALGKIG